MWVCPSTIAPAYEKLIGQHVYKSLLGKLSVDIIRLYCCEEKKTLQP